MEKAVKQLAMPVFANSKLRLAFPYHGMLQILSYIHQDRY